MNMIIMFTSLTYFFACASDEMNRNSTPKSPIIEILSPKPAESYAEYEPIFFSAVISDSVDKTSVLQYTWISNHDGTLDLHAPPDSDGRIEGYTTLSNLPHTLSLRVENSSKLFTTQKLMITVGQDTPQNKIWEHGAQVLTLQESKEGCIWTQYDLENNLSKQLQITKSCPQGQFYYIDDQGTLLAPYDTQTGVWGNPAKKMQEYDIRHLVDSKSQNLYRFQGRFEVLNFEQRADQHFSAQSTYDCDEVGVFRAHHLVFDGFKWKKVFSSESFISNETFDVYPSKKDANNHIQPVSIVTGKEFCNKEIIGHT